MASTRATIYPRSQRAMPKVSRFNESLLFLSWINPVVATNLGEYYKSSRCSEKWSIGVIIIFIIILFRSESLSVAQLGISHGPSPLLFANGLLTAMVRCDDVVLGVIMASIVLLLLPGLVQVFPYNNQATG